MSVSDNWLLDLSHQEFLCVDFVLWILFGGLSHLAFLIFSPKYRTYPKFESQMEFMSAYLSIVNAIANTYIGVWAWTQGCPKGGLMDRVCIMNPSDLDVKICIHLGNYFAFDYIVFAVLAKQTGPLAT